MDNIPISAPFEPWAIMNPSTGFYKFLFRGAFSEVNQDKSLKYIKSWAGDHGWVMIKEKRRNIPQQMMFEVRAWLR